MSDFRSKGVKSPIPGSSFSSRYCHVFRCRRFCASNPWYTNRGREAIVSDTNVIALPIAGSPMALSRVMGTGE